MWSRNYTGEAETFVMWSQGGVEICLFLLDQTARMDTKKVSTCRGSFGGFETTCFQLDRAASLDSTGMFYFSCDRSHRPPEIISRLVLLLRLQDSERYGNGGLPQEIIHVLPA